MTRSSFRNSKVYKFTSSDSRSTSAISSEYKNRISKHHRFRACHCYSTIQTLARLARVHFLCAPNFFMKKSEPKDDAQGCTSVAERMDARERLRAPGDSLILRFSAMALRSPDSASLRCQARRGFPAAPLRAYDHSLRCSGSSNGNKNIKHPINPYPEVLRFEN
jgi:hypothetical protein